MNDFSITAYHKLLQAIVGGGYVFTKFPNGENSRLKDNSVLIRHDVDWSVEYAFKLAKMEHKEGIYSTYFFLLRSPFYNLLSKESIEIVETIHELGHDIALHIDMENYGSEYEIGIQNEIKTFARYCSFLRKDIISFHRPAKDIDPSRIRLKEVSHTYETRFFKEIGYVSDSTCRWRYNHPFTYTASKCRKAFQLLIHPIWWVEKGNTPDEKFKNFLRKNQSEVAEYLKQNISFPIRL